MYSQKYKKAIADFDTAVKLNPMDSIAYCNRGNAYGSIKNHTRAIANYNKAIILNPKFSEAYYNRGVTYHMQGNIASAMVNYMQIIRLEKDITRVDPYVYLWIIGLKKLQGENGQIKKLDLYAKRQTSYVWSLIKYYIGTISEKKLFAMAKKNKGFLCEFYYYAAIKHLGQGNKNKAKNYFQKCLDCKLENYLEPKLAKLELKKLLQKTTKK